MTCRNFVPVREFRKIRGMKIANDICRAIDEVAVRVRDAQLEGFCAASLPEWCIEGAEVIVGDLCEAGYWARFFSKTGCRIEWQAVPPSLFSRWFGGWKSPDV